MNLIQTLLAFLLALGPLIVFHELGHYVVARLCGVKVLRFSVGMGKVVWSRRIGRDQTEWAVSALPLGGYVKMLDLRDPDVPPVDAADRAREFTSQSVWRRIAIVGAGPVANFILAIALFAGLYMHGVAEPGTIVRATAPASPAYLAGLRGGDQVMAVNDVPVAAWSELRWELIQAALDKAGARLAVERDGRRIALTLAAFELAGIDMDGDVMARLGLGVARPRPVLLRVLADGAGARAGLRAGDLPLAVDGKPVADGIDLIDMVRAAPGKPLLMTVQRGGAELALSVTPVAAKDEKGAVIGRIGAEPALSPVMVTVAAGPFTATAKAARKTWDTSAMTVKMIVKMITGEVSWKNVTGPITIADYAGQTARIGAVSYLSFIAFISVSLGVMNLLPIPVLDGGLLLYYSLEVLTGRPLPERVGEIAQRLGVGLLVTLMALAVFNDVMRLL